MPRRTRQSQIQAASSEEEDNAVDQPQQQVEETANGSDSEEAAQEQPQSNDEHVEDGSDDGEDDQDEHMQQPAAEKTDRDDDNEDDEDNEPEVFNDAVDEEEHEAEEQGDDEEGNDAAEPPSIPRSEAPNTVDMNDALTKARAIAAKLGTSMQRPAAEPAAEPVVEQPEDRGDDVRERRSASPPESAKTGSRGHKRGRSTSRDRGYPRNTDSRRDGRDGRRRFDGPKSPGMPPMGDMHGPMLEFQVPMDMVGLIIGRQGSNLRSIEQRHNVRVQMSQQFDRRDSERKITIEGPVQDAENARMDIMEFIDRHHGRQQGQPPMKGGRGPSGSAMQPAGFGPGGPGSPSGMTTVMVPNAKVGLIIGRGGESIREIQKISGARVQVEPDNGRGAADRPIQLIGLPAQIEIAHARIMEIVNSDRQTRDTGNPGFRPEFGNQPQGMPTPQHYQQPAPQPQQPFSPRGVQPSFNGGMPQGGMPVHVEEMQVPKEAVGVIIGRGGENIKLLQQASGARIQIIQGQDRSAPFKPVTISGDQQACLRARRMIEEKIQSVQERQPGAPGAMGYAGGRGNQYGAPAQAQAQVSMPMAYDNQGQRSGVPASALQGGYGMGGGYNAQQQQYYGGQQQQQQQQQGPATDNNNKAYTGYQGDYQAQQQPQQQQQAATGAGSEQSYQWTNQQTADYYAQYASTNPEYAQYAEYYRKLAEKDPHGIVPS
ncbi:hypothetical protein FB645_000960 [Coemansia sp. IMI 203386]|nr:hypothetical protein FB645_000960 [Coemansia sp. IMI 203386]